MQFSGKSIKRRLGPNIRVLLIPLAVIAVSAVIFTYLIKNGYPRILKQISGFKSTQSNEKALFEKFSALRSVESGILDKADATVMALPIDNPSTWVLSQLRQASYDNQVELSSFGFEGTNKVEENLYSATVKVVLKPSDFNSLYNILSDFLKLAPIFSVGDVNIEEGKEGLEAEVELTIYWSSLPTTLPQISEPIKELTTQELEVLKKVSGLRTPTFTRLTPSTPNLRAQPFN